VTLFLSQVVNGIGSGAVFASVAIALVLIFRTTGILNFAQLGGKFRIGVDPTVVSPAAI
jgi:branched-subunit amino acid ABC-type transport system permease component